MDSRAKQRLTGAIILVALFVLLVPELLTGPRETGAPADAQSSDEGMRRYTIDLNAATPAAQPETSANQPAVALPPVAQGAGESRPELATPASRPPPKPHRPRRMRRLLRQTRPPKSRRRPSTNCAPRTPTLRPNVSAKPGRFVVQLGSFGSRDNAERLVRDMTAKGFTAFVAPITSNGRELYRVRVGRRETGCRRGLGRATSTNRSVGQHRADFVISGGYFSAFDFEASSTMPRLLEGVAA
jgi:cell division septation protein DedD